MFPRYLLSFESCSLPLIWQILLFSPREAQCEHVGGGLMNRTIYWGKFSESSIGVPIAVVAGSNGQSALLLVRQVGASQDLSEATRRGAVRALWGTVTHTAAGPFSFSGSVHFVDRRLRIATFVASHSPFLDPPHLGPWIISWITSTIIPFVYRYFTKSS